MRECDRDGRIVTAVNRQWVFPLPPGQKDKTRKLSVPASCISLKILPVWKSELGIPKRYARCLEPHQERARALAIEAGLDPDAKIDRPGQRPIPTWCTFRDAARKEHLAREAQARVFPHSSVQLQSVNSGANGGALAGASQLPAMRTCDEGASWSSSARALQTSRGSSHRETR